MLFYFNFGLLVLHVVIIAVKEMSWIVKDLCGMGVALLSLST
jgi:hypothetical protein